MSLTRLLLSLGCPVVPALTYPHHALTDPLIAFLCMEASKAVGQPPTSTTAVFGPYGTVSPVLRAHHKISNILSWQRHRLS